MSLSAATIRAMADKGLSAADIADIAEADAMGAERSPGALRQAAYRERRKVASITRYVTSDASDHNALRHEHNENEPLAPIRAQVVNPSLSSLQSERAYPPNPTTLGTPQKPEKPKSRAFKRCPDDWVPKWSTLDKLDSEGFTPGDLERAMTRMRDHEYKIAKTDWDAAFRNWVRTDHDRRPQPAATDAKLAAKHANMERAFGGYERAVRRVSEF